PDLSFGPALSLGVASLDEYVDVKLLSAPDSEEVLRRLREASAEGLRFLEARRLDPREPRVNVGITGATYVLALPLSVIGSLGTLDVTGIERLERSISAFMDSPATVVMRRIKGIGKSVNVRDFVD